MYGRIDVFMSERGANFLEQIENENWLGQMDLIMNENLRMVAYGENERKMRIERLLNERELIDIWNESEN